MSDIKVENTDETLLRRFRYEHRKTRWLRRTSVLLSVIVVVLLLILRIE